MLVSDDSWESLVEEYPYPGILDTDFDIRIERPTMPAKPVEEKERYVIEIPA